MNSIKVTSSYGFIFRKEKLRIKSISNEQLVKVLETEILDENDKRLSFNSCFGREAANNLIGELSKLNLDYVDDYFLIEGDYPDWLSLRAELNTEYVNKKEAE